MTRVFEVRPELAAVVRARDAMALGRRDLLHAGPPLADRARPCEPMLNAAAAAILFEGWADTVDQARSLVRERAVVLRPAQDLGCVVPLADVLSPSMWVQVVQDGAGAAPPAFSPFNGGGEHPQRVGVFDEAVVAHLRWLDTQFAPALRAALDTPLPLIDLADRGLAGGDDCHGRTAVATAALGALITERLQGGANAVCRQYLDRSPGFFLNLWMAASRCMLAAAAGATDPDHADLVVAAGGNGQSFGIQVAARPGHWFTGPAAAPAITGAAPELAARSLGAIGDSAIVDLLGFGAMTTLRAGPPLPPEVLEAWFSEPDGPGPLLALEHPGFVRTGPRLLVHAARVVGAGRCPLVSLGVLDRAGERGRLAGGFYRAPLSVFTEAVAGIAR
jgi:hypothetical protein